MLRSLARIAVILAMLSSSAAWASAQGGGIVTLVATGSDGTTSFQNSGTRTGIIPGCATDPSWIFANNTMIGQAMLSTLLSAAVAGKNLTVVGSGTCLNSGTYWKSWWICPTSGSTVVNDGYSASRTISSDSCKTLYSQPLTAKATGRRINFYFHGPADCASASLPADGTPSLFPNGIAIVD